MIVCASLNPCFDLWYEGVGGRTEDGIHRAEESRLQAGGKALNVARALRRIDEQPVVLATGEGTMAGYWKAMVELDGIPVQLVPGQQTIRINTHVGFREGELMKVNAPGGECSPSAVAEMFAWLHHRAHEVRLAVLAGSLPPGVGSGAWSRLVRGAGLARVPAFVDTSGPALVQALQAAPACVKVNRAEIGEALGRSVATEAEAIAAGVEVLNLGVGNVAITGGADGAVLLTRSGVWSGRPGERIAGPHAVGAGDAFLAGLVAAWLAGAPPERQLARAMACAGAWIAGWDRLEEYESAAVVRRVD